MRSGKIPQAASFVLYEHDDLRIGQLFHWVALVRQRHRIRENVSNQEREGREAGGENYGGTDHR